MKRETSGHYLSKKEAAEFIGCSINFVNGLICLPDFPIFRIGRRILIDKVKLIQWIEKYGKEAN